MATVAMGAVGAGIGAYFGDPMLGFSIGVSLAGVLFPPKTAAQERGRLDDLKITGSAYGVPIPQVWGQNRIGSNILWVKKDANGNHLIEHVSESGGKGTQRPGARTYTYTASWASSVCRGPIDQVLKIYAEDRIVYDTEGGGVGDEIQQISIGTNTGGYYTVSYGLVTPHIPFNANAVTIQTELENLSTIGVGNVTVTGTGPFVVTFIGDLAGKNIHRMDMSDGTLTGGSGEGITTLQQGGTNYTIRVYYGTEAQDPDELIENAEGGVGFAPAYRGTAYVVFEDFPLAAWGNRIPALTFEIKTSSGVVTVGDVLADVFEQCGISNTMYDVTAADAEITGFTIAQRTEARQALQPLIETYFFDVAELDGELRAIARGGAVQVTIPSGHLGAQLANSRNVTPQPKVKTKRMQDIELPWHIDFTYFDIDNLYNQATQGATRYTKTHIQNSLTINVPLVLTGDEARQVAERRIYQQWTEREQFSFILPFKYILYAPGDVFFLPVGENLLRVRAVAQDIAMYGPIQFQAVLDDEDILTQTVTGGVVETTTVSSLSIETKLILWTGNALRDEDTLSSGMYISANSEDGGDWPGCVIYWSSDEGETYQILETVTDLGLFGTVVGVVPAPDPDIGTGAFDDTTTITVVMIHGTPQTTTDADVYAGANAVLVGDEIIKFGVATPTINPDEYELTHLLRGRRGTDGHWDEHVDGERFVMLDIGSIGRHEFVEQYRGKTLFFKGVTIERTLEETNSQALYISGDEWKCYASCQGEGTRLADDLTATWVRRTRSGGDLQDFQDVDDPDTESYEVEVWDSTYVTLKRTITGLSSPTTTYLAADQVIDFGSPQPIVYLTIYRLGRYGRGFPYRVAV